MCTAVCINISSAIRPQKMEVEFFSTKEWTVDAEATMIRQLQHILSIVRAHSKSVKINIDLQADEPGEVVFLLRRKMNHNVRDIIPDKKLSIREIEILELIMNGLTNQQIAEKLFISYETVRSHRKNILQKTGAKNTATLINYFHHTFFDK